MPLTPLTRLLDQYIDKPLGSYRDESTLIFLLKRRLTKKEYKIFWARVQGYPSREEMQKKLSLTEDRYEVLWQTVIRKINRDSIKRELFLY